MRFMKSILIVLLLFFMAIVFYSCQEDTVEPNQESVIPNEETPNTSPGYNMSKHIVITEEPSFINIMFQVTDNNAGGVDYLLTENFQVFEDNSEVSPTESNLNIKKKDALPYSLKTVIMLDNSLSVGDNLPEIRNAAKALVNNIAIEQEVAIYKFSENPVLLQDFTNNKNLLTSAINSIELGYSTTNLYGSVIEGVSRWEDKYSTTEIQQGFLILVTDGSDTQDRYSKSEAINARGDKNVYTVGLGSEIEPAVLTELGNAGFLAVKSVSDLVDNFKQIQNNIVVYANSFYWLNYLSPKRGDKDHTLKLVIKDNVNTGIDSYITENFNSKDFTSSVLRLLTPNGGEVWKPGEVGKITWESYNVNNVKIEISIDNGNSWNVIANVSATPAEYIYTIPEGGSSECKIRITNTDDPSIFDSSDNKFGIATLPQEACPGVPTLMYAGKIYNTVQIGKQCWLRENLDVGTMIESKASGYLQSDNGTIEKYCYDNDESNCEKYGGLYEWNEAMQYSTQEGTQGICPNGWHIPTKAEFEALEDFVGDKAAKLVDENQAATAFTPTNETGFSALLAGGRHYDDGGFANLGNYTNIWSSTEFNGDYAHYLFMDKNYSDIYFSYYRKDSGFSVRCIKD